VGDLEETYSNEREGSVLQRHARRGGFTHRLPCIMRFFYSTLAVSLCVVFCHAQGAPDDATFLQQARAKYDAPFERNLQSFNCAVEFSWKQHFNEAVRVGDEGTDEEIAKMTFDVEMMLARDMSLQSEGAKGSESDRRETDFRLGPQGFSADFVQARRGWRFQAGESDYPHL
jgi:hypothetical protein